jgi:hypothetical protein
MARKAFNVVRFFRVRVVGSNSGPSKRGYLHNFILKMNMSQSETAADKAAVAKKSLNLTWSGISPYVKVLRFAAEKQVTNTSAYQIGDKTV